MKAASTAPMKPPMEEKPSQKRRKAITDSYSPPVSRSFL